MDERFWSKVDKSPGHWRPTFNRMCEAAYAARRAKTHCTKGHPLSGDNLYLAARGSRHCKVCRHDAVRRYRERN